MVVAFLLPAIVNKKYLQHLKFIYFWRLLFSRIIIFTSRRLPFPNFSYDSHYGILSKSSRSYRQKVIRLVLKYFLLARTLGNLQTVQKLVCEYLMTCQSDCIFTIIYKKCSVCCSALYWQGFNAAISFFRQTRPNVCYRSLNLGLEVSIS